ALGRVVGDVLTGGSATDDDEVVVVRAVLDGGHALSLRRTRPSRIAEITKKIPPRMAYPPTPAMFPPPRTPWRTNDPPARTDRPPDSIWGTCPPWRRLPAAVMSWGTPEPTAHAPQTARAAPIDTVDAAPSAMATTTLTTTLARSVTRGRRASR